MNKIKKCIEENEKRACHIFAKSIHIHRGETAIMNQDGDYSMAMDDDGKYTNDVSEIAKNLIKKSQTKLIESIIEDVEKFKMNPRGKNVEDFCKGANSTVEDIKQLLK